MPYDIHTISDGGYKPSVRQGYRRSGATETKGGQRKEKGVRDGPDITFPDILPKPAIRVKKREVMHKHEKRKREGRKKSA